MKPEDTPEWKAAMERLYKRRGDLGVRGVVESIVITKRQNGVFLTDDPDATILGKLYGIKVMTAAEAMKLLDNGANVDSIGAVSSVVEEATKELAERKKRFAS